MAKKALRFEEGMEALEKLVEALEGGEMPLEESFAAYEKGVQLAGQLKNILDAGEKRIMTLGKNGEEPLKIGEGEDEKID